MPYGPYTYRNGNKYTFGADGRWWIVTGSHGSEDYGYPVSERALHHHNYAAHTLPVGLPTRHRPIGPSRHVGVADGLADYPLAQSVFHSDAGRRAFYYAPYEVATFVSAPLAVAFFLSPFMPATLALAAISRRRNPRAFDAASGVLHDFLFGTTNRHRLYLQNALETQNLQRSAGFQQLLQSMNDDYSHGRIGRDIGTDSWQAFRNLPYDLLDSPIGGQVGGDQGSWHVYRGQFYIDIRNTAGARSFFFHAVPDFPDDLDGPFNSVHQEFMFTVPIGTKP